MIDNLKHAMQKIVEFMTQSEVLQLQTDDGEKEAPQDPTKSRTHKLTHKHLALHDFVGPV